jgi:TPR repeat protein
MSRATVKALYLVVAIILALPAAAGPLEDGFAALQQKDYDKARSLFLPLAKAGNAVAQFNLGAMYDFALGVPNNDREAAQWYLKAAEQGHSDAQYRMGFLFAEGRGVNKDYKKAMEWDLRAASQGSAMAQHNIGSLYFNGYGVEKDDKKAAEWYTKAAAQGLHTAENALGTMYVKGWGVDKDVNKGLEWTMKAADSGIPIAQANAVNIYLANAKEGNPGAMHNVATLCLKGWAGEHKPEDCLAWYEQAAEKGADASRNSLAEVYDKGLFGIPIDKQRAQYWRAQIGKKAEQ